ncbi:MULTISPECIES: chemotaxis protein CheX [Sphingobium]|jgi:chemotaxis protein CheC|uniref:Chemotaxis protein CheC n=2 Tax=Sphingobium fuliginis (strain ATCC 27551) TaxID=336203 RepID=A0A292ZLC6_SPHSA|nr:MULTISPECIES: chemotaxis protein CheX [Sphingobium]OAP33103.1 chemotaxis protein CheX [Sphingobium sp. 20006FA]AJR23900.1 chemotaxis protein CheX [Sphingobium sp. YBL2]KXU32207.1 chemotaxis protein CheX [Sphingobium sp. AM]KYC32101.1 chemotaxis protein CheX [Sphingobium sp. 22B]MCB4858025.1 chemotaxis protein CheX [Sphingobium sp. PNB]
MITGHVALSELEQDALTEIVNIGVSRAASSLRKMIGDQVVLSVPSVEVVSQRRAARLISEREVVDLIAVRQDFSGPFCGRALLIFPETNSLELVRAVTGGALSAEEAVEMEQEALAETGNIILNSCLATMANMLKRSLSMTIPEVLRGNGATLFEIDETTGSEGLVLFLYIDFAVRQRDIRGYIAMLMDIPSLATLKQLLDEFISRIVGEDG